MDDINCSLFESYHKITFLNVTLDCPLELRISYTLLFYWKYISYHVSINIPWSLRFNKIFLPGTSKIEFFLAEVLSWWQLTGTQPEIPFGISLPGTELLLTPVRTEWSIFSLSRSYRRSLRRSATTLVARLIKHHKTSRTTCKTLWNTLKTLWNITKHSNTRHSMWRHRRFRRYRRLRSWYNSADV